MGGRALDASCLLFGEKSPRALSVSSFFEKKRRDSARATRVRREDARDESILATFLSLSSVERPEEEKRATTGSVRVCICSNTTRATHDDALGRRLCLK